MITGDSQWVFGNKPASWTWSLIFLQQMFSVWCQYDDDLLWYSSFFFLKEKPLLCNYFLYNHHFIPSLLVAFGHCLSSQRFSSLTQVTFMQRYCLQFGHQCRTHCIPYNGRMQKLSYCERCFLIGHWKICYFKFLLLYC